MGAKLGALLVLAGLGLFPANDGVDRYAGPEPEPLYYVAAPPKGAPATYRVLQVDAGGNASGDPLYRWARDYALDAIALSFARVYETFGPSAHPAGVFDLSSENGDTPIDFRVAEPTGRHLDSEHDGGVNLNIGYYLTSLSGKLQSPDYAACTEHFEALNGTPSKVDAGRCLDAPDRLDINRQALFYVELARLHLSLFGGDLIRVIGIDARIKQAVLATIWEWASVGEYGASPEILSELTLRLNSDPFEGWGKDQQDHTHLRFAAIDSHGPHRASLKELQKSARDGRVKLSQRSSNVLSLRLGSRKLRRFLEVRLLAAEEGLERVLYSVDGQNWVSGVSADDYRAVLPLGSIATPLGARASRTIVYAQLRREDGSEETISSAEDIPPSHPDLAVAVAKETIRYEARLEGGRLKLALHFPPDATRLITGLRFTPFGATRDQSVELDPVRPRVDIAAPTSVGGLMEVTLSGRQTWTLPIRWR